MKNWRCFTLAVAVATGMSAGAQTLDDCRRWAQEHYPEIRQYDLIAQSEQYNLSNAARSWIPQLTLSGQASYQSATPTYPRVLADMLAARGVDMAGLRKDQYKIALDIYQNIWDGGQNRARREEIKAGAEEQRRAAEVDLYALEERIDDLYFGILLLDGQIEQAEAKLTLLRRNFDKIQSYCRNGAAMQADADAVEAEMLAAKQMLEQATLSRLCFRQMLELFIGRPLNDTRLPVPEVQGLRSRESARPELSLFDAQLHRLTAQEKSLHSTVMPRFSAFAQGYYGYPGLDMFQSMLSEEWSLNLVAGVRLSWNIGAFYTRKNDLQLIRTRRSQVEVNREIFLFNTRLGSSREEGEIERLRRAVADDDRIVELRRRVRMAAESQLENGVIDVTALLQKITDETTASLARRTHETELLQSLCRLKHMYNQ
ncbi:MAG: TolC family protein [Coprobacter sp.]|nr:TolC family protein [Coprobacter sp.]